MNLFPITCVDDFYKDPYKIRELASSLDYENKIGNYPGVRSPLLHKVLPDFFNVFCQKFFSLFYNYECEEVKWVIQSYFQKVYSYDDEELNVGHIHRDEGGCIFAGLIYLNPNPVLDSGTSLYSLKESETFDYDEEYSSREKLKRKFYRNELDDTTFYKQSLKKHNSKFKKTLEIKNIYNRLVSYPYDVWHSQSDFKMNDEPRLTQVFFVEKLQCPTTPLSRSKNYDL